VHREIKRLRSTAPEEIPEVLVRGVLAKQYGIRPEEVTAKQIRYGIAELLRAYPVIRLTPLQPVEDGSAADAELPERRNRPESVGEQIDRYRGECRMTLEDLARDIGVTLRTVQRHIVDAHQPSARHVSAYERSFSSVLKRDVIIER
jgi:hypothetical protein